MKHFLLKEKWLSSTFFEIQVSEALPNLPLCASFWRRLWLQKPIENFLCVVSIRSEYIKHSPRSGEYSALWFMTVRPTKHFLLKEKWLSSEYFEIQVFEALPNLPLCVFFWRWLWLQKPVENFLCVVRIRFEYLKHSPDPSTPLKGGFRGGDVRTTL